MATFTYADLSIPQSALVADLYGIATDLQRTRAYAQRLLAQFSSEQPDWELVEPLSIAITVSYSSAFSDGVRTRLQDDDLNALSDDQRAMHQFLRDIRDKHIAHSVNAFEENTAHANYCQERVEEEGITSIGYGGGRVAGLSHHNADRIIEITNAPEGHVRERIKNEENKLLEFVRAMPLKDVLAGGQKAF